MLWYTPNPEAADLLTNPHPSPLTQLSEEETLFASTVRRFAEETIAPLVRTMDDEQQFAPGLVQKLFELGLMGIEIPEAMGGAAAASLMLCSPSRPSPPSIPQLPFSSMCTTRW